MHCPDFFISNHNYPARAHAQQGVKQSVLVSVCLSVCLSVTNFFFEIDVQFIQFYM